MAECPQCSAQVEVKAGTEAGEIIFCSDCGGELEVLAKDPIALALAPEVEEDWGE